MTRMVRIYLCETYISLAVMRSEVFKGEINAKFME